MANVTNPQEFLDLYCAAVEALDVDAMLSLYAEDVRVFDVMEPAEYHDREAFSHQVREWFGSLEKEEAGCDVDEVSIVESDGLAVISGFVEYEGIFADTGDEVEMDSRMTWVLQKFGDAWLVVHEHSSVPVTDDDEFEADSGWILLDDVTFGDDDDDEEDEMSEDQVNEKGESDAETVDGQDVEGMRDADTAAEPSNDGEQLGDKKD